MDLGYEQQGSGPAVIMVHGLGGTSNTFQPQASILARRFRVIRPDLPGAGRSASLPAGSLTTVAAALIALANRLDADSFHLVGHSLGTVISQILAAEQASRILSLTLLGPLAEAAPAARTALAERATRVRHEGLDWFVDGYIAGSLAKKTNESNPAVGAFLRESLTRQTPARYADFCEELARHTAVPLSRIAAPTLLLTGDEDKVGTVPVVTAMAQQLPHARVQIIKNCGHWLTVECPDEVTSAMSQHLEAASGSP